MPNIFSRSEIAIDGAAPFYVWITALIAYSQVIVTFSIGNNISKAIITAGFAAKGFLAATFYILVAYAFNYESIFEQQFILGITIFTLLYVDILLWYLTSFAHTKQQKRFILNALFLPSIATMLGLPIFMFAIELVTFLGIV